MKYFHGQDIGAPFLGVKPAVSMRSVYLHIDKFSSMRDRFQT